MDELRALLERFGLDADNPDYTTLTDEQLVELQTGLFGLFDSTRDGEVPDLELLEAIALGGEAIRVEDAARQDQAAADADRVEALAASVGRPRARQVPLRDLARYRRPANTPSASDSASGGEGAAFVAQAGERAGQQVGVDDIAELIADGVRQLEGLPIPARVPVARARAEYSAEQQLDDSSEANGRRIEHLVASAQALGLEDGIVAAGGRCGPATVRWDQDVVGSDARPVRDALVPFQGRLAVRYVQPPTLADIVTTGATAAVGVWTNDMDVAAVNDPGTRKPIQRVTCGTELTVETEAVTERLLVPLSLARSNPERLRAFIDLVTVAQARLAEQQLIARIKAGSTQTAEDGQVLGSRRDLLAVWSKAAWGIRNRNRDENLPLQLVIPDAVVPHNQIDGLRQMPGDQRDRLTRAEVIAEMTGLGIQVVITPDMQAHLAPAQAAGAPIADLPAPIQWGLWPVGTWGFLDGGTFDLGFGAATPVQDSALLAANDFQLFAETFERAVRFLALDSLWGRTMVAPTGEVAGTVDMNVDLAS